MTVDDKNVFVTIVVEIDKCSGPTAERSRGHSDAILRCPIIEKAVFSADI